MENKEFTREQQQLDTLFTEEFIAHSKPIFQEFNTLMAYYRCAMMEVETKLNVLNEEFSLQFERNPISGIKTRLKKVTSIREKLQRRGYPLTVQSVEENLNDVAGVRVICSFPEDVYTIADALLGQDDITLIRKKDYVLNPKPNGYRSLHLIIAVPIFLAHEKRVMRVEVQLRTIAMDFWATLEHQLRYKKDITFTEDMAKDLKFCAELSAELDRRMDALRDLTQAGSGNTPHPLPKAEWNDSPEKSDT